MNKLKSKRKKILFNMKAFQFNFHCFRVKRTNCLDKNILRSAVGRNDLSAACSGEKKAGL